MLIKQDMCFASVEVQIINRQSVYVETNGVSK